ncbi:hypothetical protein [Actinomadura geliboluensis]|uniref:hypothetical protein n=1 Tax=Actinomadura geliboluensis TaxID=882440 RepID=UPI0036BA9617
MAQMQIAAITVTGAAPSQAQMRVAAVTVSGAAPSQARMRVAAITVSGVAGTQARMRISEIYVTGPRPADAPPTSWWIARDGRFQPLQLYALRNGQLT